MKEVLRASKAFLGLETNKSKNGGEGIGEGGSY